MRNVKKFALLAVCLPLLAVAVPKAEAGVANHDTYLSFSQPVEIPGRVLLPGRYEFKYLTSNPPGEVVGVFDSNGKFVELFTTEPVYRAAESDHTVVTLESRGSGSPKAIKSWFYPDDPYGVRFIYPNAKSAE
jgi:hypothetical protein